LADLNQTPSSERVHISIFGRRNSGKSSLINALTNQALAIVSDVPGTTTDPVSKSMEILPIGPVVLTDTAGIDDTGELGKLRVDKSLRVLERTDLAVLVVESGTEPREFEVDLVSKIKERDIPLVIAATKTDIQPDFSAIRKWAEEHSVLCVPVSSATRDGIERLKEAIIQISPTGLPEPTIIGDLITGGDIVVLVVPIDTGAPKGRLILPQVMTIRDVLDHDAIAVTVKERDLSACLDSLAQAEAGCHRLAGICESQRRYAPRRLDDQLLDPDGPVQGGPGKVRCGRKSRGPSETRRPRPDFRGLHSSPPAGRYRPQTDTGLFDEACRRRARVRVFIGKRFSAGLCEL
jgi:[FeFe] hydrogenase H-cluster maturation GTPase HydF